MCLGKRHRTKRNLHRSGKLRKDHNMKKNIVAVLLVIALSTAAAFAATNPPSSSFDVTTNVGGINKMKITAAAFPANGNPSAFDSAAAFAGPLGVTASGAQTFSAYLSTMSNNRVGYKVTMSATAMSSTVSSATAYINYTVGVNNKSLTTAGATAVTPVEVITVSRLTGLASQSHQISLSVDATSFDAAIEGCCSGSVTFTYTAN